MQGPVVGYTIEVHEIIIRIGDAADREEALK
jgi:hypothetical protein